MTKFPNALTLLNLIINSFTMHTSILYLQFLDKSLRTVQAYELQEEIDVGLCKNKPQLRFPEYPIVTLLIRCNISGLIEFFHKDL